MTTPDDRTLADPRKILGRRSPGADLSARLGAVHDETQAASTSRGPAGARPGSSPIPILAAPVRGQDMVRARLHVRLLDHLADEGLLDADADDLRTAVAEFVDTVLATEDLPLNERERENLSEDLVEDTIGLGPLAPLMADPAISDILVNGPSEVFVERFGRLERASDIRFLDDAHLVRVIERLAARNGRRIDQSSPMVDLRLPDGSRVNATIPPLSIDYPTLSIRRFGNRRLRRSDLVRVQMLSPAMSTFLDLAVRARRSILVSGGTGAGKSTLLGAIAEAIPSGERIVTIEDPAELQLDQEHVVRMEVRPPNIEGLGEITSRQIVINALRMRPNRILMGEIRGGEAFDLLQALNTGHQGGMTTVHANSPRDALARLETMVLMAGMELPARSIREQIAAAIDFVVHVERSEDGVRRVSSITELSGLEGGTATMQDVFRFERTAGGPNDAGAVAGRRTALPRRIAGRFVPTGVVPRFIDGLRRQGVDVPMDIFRPEAGGADPTTDPTRD